MPQKGRLAWRLCTYPSPSSNTVLKLLGCASLSSRSTGALSIMLGVAVCPGAVDRIRHVADCWVSERINE